MISFGAAIAAGAPPGFAPNGDAPVDGAFDAALAFGDVLQGLMGKSAGFGSAAVEEEAASARATAIAADALINDVVIETAVLPALGRPLAVTWLQTGNGVAIDTAAAPETAAAHTDGEGPPDVSRSWPSPPKAADAQPGPGIEPVTAVPLELAPVAIPVATEVVAAGAAAPVGVAGPREVDALGRREASPAALAVTDMPLSATTVAAARHPATDDQPTAPSMAVDPVVAGAFGKAATTPETTAPTAASGAGSPAAAGGAAVLDRTVATVVRPRENVSVIPTPVDADPAAATTAAVAPTATPIGRPAAAPASRATSEPAGHEPEAPPRVDARVAEAGHRAYVAAATDTPSGEFHGESGGPRGDHRATAEPAAAAAAGAPATVAPAFHVIAERPAPLAGPAGTAAAALDAPRNLDANAAAELPAQVVQSIRLQAIAGGGEAVVRLRPDYLGELVVVVKVTNGAVTAALQSDTPAVRRWVEANEATLRLGLAEHGLQLDRLTVSGDAPVAETGERERQRDGRSPGDDESQQPESRRRRPQDPEATFEVIV